MSAAEQLHPEPARALLMHGSYDTLIENPGANYASVSLADIEAMAREPACEEKLKAPCAIFSTYLAHDGRAHKVQADRGTFIALPGDIDQGSPHIAEVDAAIVAVYGDVRRLIYSTASATPSNRKWRFIVPLAEPIPGAIYHDLQRAAFDLMAAQGITCDKALERPAQVAYLPNVPKDRRDGDGVPLFYDFMLKGAELFSASGSAIESRMIEMQRADEEARAQAQAQARARAERRRATHTGSLPNVIDEFNAATSIEDLLQSYGYQRKGNDWQSKYQESGSYATRIMDGGEAWVSLSESDAAAGLGTAGPRVGVYGDAFDLFKHYEHGGDHNAALAAAAKSIKLRDGRTLDEARADEWKRQRDEEAARIAEERRRAAEPGAGESGPLVDLSGLSLDAIAAPDHKIERLLPAEAAVTLLGGHGGAGKSQLGLLLAVCLATGRPFLGLPVKRSRVLFYSAEDGRKVLLHRLARIASRLGITADDLHGWLRVYDMTECDPVLYREDRRGCAPTERYIWLRDQIEEAGAEVVVIDNASDAFDASEISRPRVREFIRLLSHLVKPRGGSVLLLAHVDKSTAKAGSGSEGYSGSTAWNNSVRSRLYLFEQNGGLILEHQKANYGPKADALRLHWQDGLLAAGDAVNPAEPLLEYQRLRAVLRLVRDFNERGEFLGTGTTGPGNTHQALRNEAGYPPHLARDDFYTLLRDAERQKLIERGERRTPDRKHREHWQLTAKGRVECQAYAPDVDGAAA